MTVGADPGGASLLGPVARYYTDTLARFGATPRGVDWNGAASQETRFAQLARLFEEARVFSLNDLGCGYGALYDYLTERDFELDYRGYDVSEAMLEAARARPRARGQPTFVAGSGPAEVADFSVASGIFNVRLGAADAAWREHMRATLEDMHRSSRRGFAFNCLTSHSDPERRRSDLYYADPARCVDLCLRRFSRRVTLLHDYGLYEFTIIVRPAAP